MISRDSTVRFDKCCFSRADSITCRFDIAAARSRQVMFHQFWDDPWPARWRGFVSVVDGSGFRSFLVSTWFLQSRNRCCRKRSFLATVHIVCVWKCDLMSFGARTPHTWPDRGFGNCAFQPFISRGSAVCFEEWSRNMIYLINSCPGLPAACSWKFIFDRSL